MKRIAVVAPVMILALLLLPANKCRHTPRPPFTLASIPKRMVRVEFEGGMCHVLDRSSKSPRVVFLYNPKTTHVVNLFLPKNLDVTPAQQIKEITDAFGIAPQAVAGGGYRVKGVTGFIFRILDPAGSGGPMQPALASSMARTTDFDFLVPHLSTVAKVAEGDLDPGIDGDPSTKFVDFFELDGGILSAVPYCKLAVFDPDNDGRGNRAFAQVVALTGSTTDTAVLQLRKSSADQWTTLHFGSVDFVRITFRNQPDSSDGMPHFDMHHYVMTDTSGAWPDIPPGKIQDFCPQSDTVPGCANTTWP